MFQRTLLIPVVAALMISQAPSAEAGGLLQRLFGKRCCVKRTVCQPKPCASTCRPNYKPCMNQEPCLYGCEPLCEAQRLRDACCCACAHAGNDRLRAICMQVAAARKARCLRGPDVVDEEREPCPPECDLAPHYGCNEADPEEQQYCQYMMQLQCEECQMDDEARRIYRELLKQMQP